jgi:hypothetical protein
LYEEVEDESVGDIVREAVLDAAERLVGEEVADPALDERRSSGLNFLGVLPDDVTDGTIAEVVPSKHSAEIHVYEELEGDSLLLHASVQADVSFEGFMYKPDFYASADDDRLEILDPDWNDHMVFVSFATEATLWFDVVAIGRTVENITFDYAEPLGL